MQWNENLLSGSSVMLKCFYVIWKWTFGLSSQKVFTDCPLIRLGVRGTKTTTYYVRLDNGPGRSQPKGHGKGDPSSDNAFRFQTVHNLTNYLISVLYPTHFDCVFFLMNSKLLPVSAFWSLSCHFLYFIERWSFLWSCLCNSPSSERWMLGVVELLLNYFMTGRKSCWEVAVLS